MHNVIDPRLRRWTTVLGALALALALRTSAHAAVSCSLTDPDRDVRKAFSTSTGYRTEFHSVKEEGGEAFRRQFEALYGRPLDPYAEYDIQHAFYPVLKGKELIGYMYGATQKGKLGTLQVIAITDPTGSKITSIYYQKLSAPWAKQLKAEEFTKQFAGLTLADFKGWQTDPKYAGKLSAIKAPTPESQPDVTETLWGLKKVLMLFDHYYRQDVTLKMWMKGAGQ